LDLIGVGVFYIDGIPRCIEEEKISNTHTSNHLSILQSTFEVPMRKRFCQGLDILRTGTKENA